MKRTYLFAGGGSGGHISPGLAIAERLLELQPDARLIVLCSQRAIDADMLSQAGVEHITLPARPFSRKPLAAARFAIGFVRSIGQVKRIIKRQTPAHLVALGGFVAAPAVAAAAGRIPVTLLNLDAPPGKANLVMARKCDLVLSAIDLPAMPRFAHRIVGMPIRRAALAGERSPAQCREQLGLDPEKQTLLVTGASQGATSINNMMIEIARSRDAALLQGKRQVLHLTGGDAGASEIKSAYDSAGIHAMVLPFLHEMGLAWGAAGGDGLAISRAGASSVAEAWANAVPTIFMPYPYHADEHQRHNAQPMVATGGAVIVKDMIEPKENTTHIAPTLQRLYNDRLELEAMSRRLRESPPPDAAEILARLLIQHV